MDKKERIKKLEAGVEKVKQVNKAIKEAKELQKDVKKLKSISNKLEIAIIDKQIARKEKQIKELKDSQYKHRDGAGRLIRRKLKDERGEYI